MSKRIFHAHAVLAALLWSAAGSTARSEDAPAAAGAESAQSNVVFVQKDETIEVIAQRTLGSADAADELRAFNQIAPGAQPEAGAPIVLPGPERSSAIEALAKADQAMQAAVKTDAGSFAAELFKRAVSLQDNANQSRKVASYSRAQTLASLASAEFAKAAAEADKRANVGLPLKLTGQNGDVVLGQDGVSAADLKQNKAAAHTGSRIATGPGAYAALELPSGGVLALGESTVVEIARSTQDKRHKTTAVVVLLIKGELEAVSQAGSDADPELVVVNGGINIAAGKARLWTSRTPEGVLRLSCLENKILLNRDSNPVELGANFGAYAAPNQNVKLPIRLPPAPVFVAPRSAESVTARQKIDLAWELPEYSAPCSYVLRQARDVAELSKAEAQSLSGSTQHTTGVLPTGDHFFMLRAIDGNGLKGPSSSVVKISVAPNLEIELGKNVTRASRGGRNVVGPGTVFRAQPAKSDTSAVGFEYSLNGGPFQRSDKGIELGENGEFVVAARAVGADGKTGEPAQEIVLVDAKSPDLRVHIGEVVDFPGYGQVRSVSVLVDDDTKLGKTEFSLNKGAFEPYANPLKLSIEKDFRVVIRAFDHFGNKAETSFMLERLGNPPAAAEHNETSGDPQKKKGFRLF